MNTKINLIAVIALFSMPSHSENKVIEIDTSKLYLAPNHWIPVKIIPMKAPTSMIKLESLGCALVKYTITEEGKFAQEKILKSYPDGALD